MRIQDLPSVPGANEKAFSYYPPLQRVKAFVEQNCADNISLVEAARVAAMESTYFSTFFRSKVGIPFSDWLRRVRIARAMEMIRQRNHTISEVAFAVGFNDLRTFGRAFKRYTNSTPMTFKKRCRPESPDGPVPSSLRRLSRSMVPVSAEMRSGESQAERK